jgi:ubiquinone/menaquinone biosynthesis C-methylase UbiE
MRDYTFIDAYLNILLRDIYPQPEDAGHINLAQEVIDMWCSRLTNVKSVLDVGCGTGFCQPMFEKHGIPYTGIALGTDVVTAINENRNVKRMDFNFLEYEDLSFDMIFSRHSLEHSPMPLLTLMEWARVSKNWLGIILPAPEHYTFEGLNHYSVMTIPQIQAIIPRAGWNIIWFDTKEKYIPATEEIEGHFVPEEYWVFCEKTRKK